MLIVKQIIRIPVSFEFGKVMRMKPDLKSLSYLIFQRYLPFFNIRRVILFTFVVACLCLVASFVYPWVGLQNIKLPDIPTEKIENEDSEIKVELKPYEFYAESISGRRIFNSVSTQETIRNVADADTASIKNLNLVGVILGDEPQAAIEDKKKQKTYYVTKGQFIDEFQIEDIQEEKIIINYKGQRFELHL